MTGAMRHRRRSSLARDERLRKAMTTPLLRIGTRGSPLALIQAETVRQRLVAAHAELAATGALELVRIRTPGDLVRDRPLAAIGGKGPFTTELQAAPRARGSAL